MAASTDSGDASARAFGNFCRTTGVERIGKQWLIGDWLAVIHADTPALSAKESPDGTPRI